MEKEKGTSNIVSIGLEFCFHAITWTMERPWYIQGLEDSISSGRSILLILFFFFGG